MCRSVKGPLYSFPNKKVIAKKWEENLKIGALAKLKVCKAHFEDKCWGKSKSKLKFDAIPTLSLGK